MPILHESNLIGAFLYDFPQIGQKSPISQGVVGMTALILFMLDCSVGQFLPEVARWGTFAYVLFSLSSIVILGIQQNNRTTQVGKQYHYCEVPIEAIKYQCKRCGKEQ